MNIAQLRHPPHLLAAAIDARAGREAEHLARVKAAAERRAARRANAQQSGNPPPALGGPA